jgi:hypothetical protein
MRLVTAVTTLIQLKRPNYFRPKNPLSEIEFLSARQHRIANVWCGSVGLAVDQRWSTPDDRTFSVPVGMSQGGQERPLAYFASQVCPAGRQQPNARALT